MTCNLGDCAGEGGSGVVGLLTTCIVFFINLPFGSLCGSMGALFRRSLWAHFWSIVRKAYGGHRLREVVHHTF